LAQQTTTKRPSAIRPSEEELIKEQARELCKHDLFYLTKEVLGYNKVTEHCHADMVRDIDTPNYKFKLLLWPRGHYKSTIGTESRSIQKILKNPNERILLTNAKLDNARKFKAAIAAHFKYNPVFRWIWREWWIKQFATTYDEIEKGERLDWVVRDTQDEFRILRPGGGREASITTGAVDSSLVSQHFCLFPETKVMTSKGYVPAKEIRKGHRVLSSDGKFNVVEAVKEQSEVTKGIVISSSYQSESNTFTVNHQILVWRNNSFQWVLAEEVTYEDMLVVPKPQGLNRQFSKVNDRIQQLMEEPEIWKLIGYWLAEGCHTPKGNQIRIVTGVHEPEFAEDIQRIVKEHLKVPISCRETKSSTFMLCFSDPDFKQILNRFGNKAPTKVIPPHILNNYMDKQIELIKGYFRGDGCVSGNTVSFTSTSLSLISGLQILLTKFDIPSGIVKGNRAGETAIAGNKCNMKDSWILWSTHPLLKLLLGLPAEINKKPFRSFFTEKYWVVGITNIEKITVEPTETYDIQVKDSQNFYCPGMIVHNSTIIADDIINREYVRTVEMVEKSKLYFKDLLDLLDPDGVMEIIGTRWSFLDLYSWIIDEFGKKATFRIPDKYTGIRPEILKSSKKTEVNDKEWLISIRPCYESDGVTPIFPEEFTPSVLEGLKISKGPYEFGAQYELNPVSEANQKFKEEWFTELSEVPSAKDMRVCITVDPAKSLRDDSDYSVIVVCGYDDKNRMFLLDGINDKLTIDELPDVLFEVVREWTFKSGSMYPVGFEAVGFQETYVSTLNKMMFENDFFFMIEPIQRKSNLKKEERILGLVPRVKAGFYIPKTLIKKSLRGHEYDFITWMKWQFLKFPFAEHDDITDALADQLLLVQYTSISSEKVSETASKKAEFVHPSILEDKAGIKSKSQTSDAVR
jgi:phage terminase large subunit-like protein